MSTIINPKTGRSIKVGGTTYNALVEKGLILPSKAVSPVKDKEESPKEDEKTPPREDLFNNDLEESPKEDKSPKKEIKEPPSSIDNESNPLMMDNDKENTVYLLILDKNFEYLEDADVQRLADSIEGIDPESDVRLVFGLRDKSIEGKFFAENEEIREIYNRTIKRIPETQNQLFMMDKVLFIIYGGKYENIPLIMNELAFFMDMQGMDIPIRTGLLKLDNGEEVIVHEYESYR